MLKESFILCAGYTEYLSLLFFVGLLLTTESIQNGQ